MAQPAKAIVTYPPQDGLVWKLEDVVVREPGDTEVQVRIIASGICHSDLVCSMMPPERAQYPIVLGHEGTLS
jgi:D-arabinose 1-dehydrogenase-like Zn-dependent alcohol dehydrogenase